MALGGCPPLYLVSRAGAASTLFSEPLGPSKCVPMPLLCPKGREAERGPWTAPLPEEQGPARQETPLPAANALENPFSGPTPLPLRKVGSGLHCPSGTGVSVCGEEVTTRGAQGKSDVRFPRGQERTATICSPALASLSALGERRLRPTLSALLPPPGHSRPSLGGRGQERPLSPGTASAPAKADGWPPRSLLPISVPGNCGFQTRALEAATGRPEPPGTRDEAPARRCG